jgi:vitamin B12 transporter
VRFGADALGGGVNLVSDQAEAGTHGGVSYEAGSFATHRVTAGARHLHEPSGLYARVDGFFDSAANDYPVDVEVPDDAGRLSPARVPRFHDGYRAGGGSAELGVFDRPWARALVLRGFGSAFDKEYQHNQAMNRVYGDVTYGEDSGGASLRYEQPLGRGLSIDAVGGYAFTRGEFRDVSPCVYDWFGDCIMEGDPGEIDGLPHHQVFRDRSGFARSNLTWAAGVHTLRLSLAPTYASRTGDERRQSSSGRDPLSGERDLLTLVTGLEHEVDLFSDRLESIVFAKHYGQWLDSEEPRPGGEFRRQDRTTQRFGAGSGLRYHLVDWMYAKASYEWATRLPRPDEVFGDNALVAPNLELEPETSHNLNLGLAVDGLGTPVGRLRAGVTGFARLADQLIVLLGNERDQSHQNVYGARSFGVEAAAEWTSPGDYLVVDGNVTYQDFRNSSSAGAFGSFEGDRIPNRPYLFAHGSARLQLRGVVWPDDEIAGTWSSRYVRDYYRGWESVGIDMFKQVIPSQLVHAAGVGYLVRGGRGNLSTTVEVQNLTDQAVYDFYGVQRPGRAVYLKTAVEF